ncbi:leukotoxin LktA family filamentous adhesin [Methyloversatilis thermotolerans]|uniref:leukotoxin LktA family filamentous adhesin n=1 Tax=Methyloversatilis thermotolerans TaxID=1346290 RepID=UPI000372E01F|nr:leukotoxin LktA family filamentous adhesin [Methyloversatilis thermotolerans]
MKPNAQRRRSLPRLRTLVANLRAPSSLLLGMSTLPALLSPSAWAQAIQTDGNTLTTVTTAGAVTDVRTATVRGDAGFNSFRHFSVNTGHTANLHLPDGTVNLINIVRDSRVDIQGTLNALRDGRIGGNVFFASSHGFVVGAGGVVNVGSLSVSTPTQGFVDGFFRSPGVPDAGSVAQLLNGTAPLSSAAIRIDGRVNAVEDVTLLAGTVSVGGQILTGGRFEGRAPDFSDVVNAQGLAQGSRVIEKAGRIYIAADEDIEISGTLDARGGSGVAGGEVVLRAGRDIIADVDAMVTAAGDGEDSHGGRIDSLAQRSALIRSGAVMDASAGASGDGGFIEFSARDTVELAGGQFHADGRNGGAAGTVLIDPDKIILSANLLRTGSGYPGLPSGGSVTGANLLLQADESITVNENVVVSSRSVAGNHTSGVSTGDSGDITFEAPVIVLKSGSQVLANADSGFEAGDVTFTAKSVSLIDILGYREATASIELDGATVKGRNVTMTASTDVQNRWIYDEASFQDNAANFATTGAENLLGIGLSLLGINIVHSQAVGTATIALKAGSTVEATQDVTLLADNLTSAGAAPDSGISGPGTQVNTPLGLGALYARNSSTATVDVKSGASVKAANLTVRANNDATLEAAIEAADPGEDANAPMSLALGLAFADVKANATVEAGATIKVSGDVTVAATNRNSFTHSVTASLGNEGKAAAAVAVSEFSSEANASLNANVADATRVRVLAVNDTTTNATTSEAKVGTSLNDSIIEAAQEKAKPLTDTTGFIEEKLWEKLLGGEELDEKVKPTSTPLRIGGAIAWVDSDASASATIGDGARVHASDSTVVAARTLGQDIQVMTEASAISQSKTQATGNTARNTFSAGISIANYSHDALARIGANAVVTAPRIAVASDVIIPVRETLITGGSFTRWDGLSTVKDWFNDLTGILDVFNGSSAAKSRSDGSNNSIALSGSVSLLRFDHSAKTEVGESAQLNVTGSETGEWSASFETVADDSSTDDDEQVLQEWAFKSPVDLSARRDVTLLFHGGHFIPGSAGGGSGSKGLGMAYTQETLTGDTLVFVREGAQIRGVTETVSGTTAGERSYSISGTRAASAVNIEAEAHDLVISMATLAGSGASFGVNGSVSIVDVNNTTRALVDDEATLRAGSLSLAATDTPVLWSIAGGFNKSESTGVGVGIAYIGADNLTEARVGDNDDEDLLDGDNRSSSRTVAGATVRVGDVSVEARADGRMEAIAVTGAVAGGQEKNENSSSGFFGSISQKYTDIQNKLSSIVDQKPTSVSQGSNSTASSPSASSKPSFGLAGAGSAAVNDVKLVTRAEIDGVTIEQDEAAKGGVTVRGVSDLDIVTASGAAALNRGGNSSQSGSAAVAGSVSVNIIDNTVEGLVENSTLNDPANVTVQALAGGEQLSIAIGAAVNTSGNNGQNSKSLTGSLSLSLVDNTVTAAMRSTDFTGAGVAGGLLDVTAYNRMFIGTGGGTLAFGGKTSAGGSITYSDIDNTVLAEIAQGSTANGIDAARVRAYNATEIGAGAAHGQASANQDSNAIGGAVVITDIDNDTTARIAGLSVITAKNSLDVLAQDRGADATLENIIEPGNKRENTVLGLDYCGRQGAGVTTSGNCITSVAGVMQVNIGSNSNSVGGSFNWSSISNDLTAKIEDAQATVTAAGGTLNVKAESDVVITSIAVGVGVSGKVSAAGSVTVNFIDNDLLAGISAPSRDDGHDDVSASVVTVRAADRSRIDTLAGAISASMNSVAIGASVTYADITNTVQAQIDRAHIDAANSLSLLSSSDARIRSLAVAGTVALGANPAVSASISLNFIGNRTDATVDDALIEDSGDTNAVTVSATDNSTLESLAGAVAVGIGQNAFGAAFGYSKIGNSTLASIEDSEIRDARTLSVSAAETSTINTMALAVGGAQTVALSGSVTLNHIGKYDGDSNEGGEAGNVTTAEIVGTTLSNSAGNSAITVSASDSSTIKSLAGAAAFSGNTAIGGAIGDNWVRNTARARVHDSTVGGAASLTLNGSNSSLIESASVSGAGAATGAFAGSASSNRTDNRTVAEITGSEVSGGTASVAVNATDSASINSLAGAVGISGSAGVGAAVSVNKIANDTLARVSGTRGGGLNVRHLVIDADSLAAIKTAAAGVGAGVDVGVGGSVAVNLINSDTQALIENGAEVEASGNVGVLAESDDRITLLAGAAGVGVSVAGVGASISVNEITGTTEAAIRGSEVAARARLNDNLSINSGEIGGVDLRDSIDRMSTSGGGYSTSDPFVAPDLAASRGSENMRGLAVNASATHQTTTAVANVGGGLFAGVAATISTTIIDGETRATISDSLINGGDNSTAGSAQAVSVKASDHAYGNTFIGSIAIGIAGVGASADVNVFDRDTTAGVSDSTLTARGASTVKARSSQGVSSIVVGASGGAVAVVGSGSVAKFTSRTMAFSDDAIWQVGSLDVRADHDSVFLVAGGGLAAGGIAGAGTFAVGLDTSTTEARVDGGSVDADGQVNVVADNSTEMRTWAIGGAGGGAAGVAGAVAVGIIDSTTTAHVSDSRVGSSANRSGGLNVSASDAVVTESVAGAGAVGGIAGVGAGASVTKVDNTTSAYVADTSVYVDNDVAVTATATRELDNTAAAAAIGGTAGIGGAVAVTVVNAGLNGDARGEADKDNNGTLSKADSFSNGGQLASYDSSKPDDDAANQKANVTPNSNFSKSDIDRVNARGQVATKSTVNATPDGTTSAAIRDTDGVRDTISANGDVRVAASEKDAIDTLAGGLAIGGLAGVGASVAVTDVRHNVQADIEGLVTVTAGDDVEVSAETGNLYSNRNAVRAEAFQAAGGLVGVGAAVATANLGNTVAAGIGRGVTVNATSADGAVTVDADDSSSVRSKAQGYAVGAVAAGVVVSTASKGGSVSATIADVDAQLNQVTNVNWGGGALTVSATRTGAVSAFSRAGSGGVYAGNGSGADASDSGVVLARVGEDVMLDGDGVATIGAGASPSVDAEADGYGGALTAYIGVSVAKATSTSTVDAAVHATQVSAGGLTVSAAQFLAPNQFTTSSDAQASGGGLLLGASATDSQARSTSTVRAALASGSVLDVDGDVRVSATNDTRQKSRVSGVVVGLLAAGFNDADTQSTSTTTASVANGVTGAVGDRLEVLATGSADNFAEAESGSGGLLAGAGATADTSTTATTTAVLGGGSTNAVLDAEAIQVKAEHTAKWNGAVDTVQAALAGASGATSSNVVVSNLSAGIAGAARLTTRDLDILARNVSLKPLLANGVFNASAGTGGLISGAAASSYSLVTNNTRAGIGDNAVVNVTGDVDDPGATRMVAVNELDMQDRTKLDTGGAIAIAQAESSIVASNLAEVRLGQGARLDAVGDVNFGSRIDADVQTSANARTYGLAGAAMGTSTTVINYNNSTLIADGASIRADGYINLMAGRDAAGTSNDINARARTDLFNKTLAPIIESQLKADAAVGATNYVEIAGNAQVRSVKDVNLGAIRGSNIADGQGVGKDLWREAAAAVASFFSNMVGQGDVSLDLHGGTSVLTGSAGVRVDGLVDAGIQNKQRLVINYTGANPDNIYDDANIQVVEQTEGVHYTISTEDRVASLFSEIDRLTTLREQYSGDAASEAAYDNEINRITQQLLEEGLASRELVTNENGVQVYQLVPLEAAPVKYINVQDVLARGGDINVTGDYLVGGAGATLKARKDTEIFIDNNSPFYLRTGKLTIADTGGKLTLNGATIPGDSSSQINAAINLRNAPSGSSASFGTVQTSASSPAPSIEVRNDYNPPSDPRATLTFNAPDIQITGNVTNVTGSVKVVNAKGSIIVQGLGNEDAPTILADSIDIAAGKNFVQAYVNGFFTVGGAALARDEFGNWGGAWGSVAAAAEANGRAQPVTTNSYSESNNTPHVASGPGVIAGNNVFISARYLDINGVVQAGVVDWKLDLSSSLDSTIAGFANDYATRVAKGERPASPLYALTASDLRAGKIGTYYNAETGLIEVDAVKVEGGYMQLFGEIISTGNGQLKVVDGYGRVNIDNNTSYALQINGIDTGNDIEGKIRITDTAFRYDGSTGTIVTNHAAANFNSLRPVTTEITRLGNQIVIEKKVVDSTGSEVTIKTEDGGTGRTSHYDPLTGQRYVYTTGNTFQKIDVYQAYEDSAIGFIPSGSGNYDYGPFTSVRTGDPLLSGEYVDQAGQSNLYEYDLTRYSTTGSYRASRKTWSECVASTPGVCWERRYWVEDTWVQGKKDFNVHSLKADQRISIEFIGWDANSAQAGVNIESRGDVTLVGAVSNRDQTTTITSSDGAIKAGSDFALVSGKTVSLNADTGIGGEAAPILVNLQDGGWVSAETRIGDVALKAPAGDLVINEARTGDGKVSLEAERSIVAASIQNGVAVIGDSIQLDARTGTIGSSGRALNLQTRAADGGTLQAHASGDIVIRHSGSGDVRIVQIASAGGDVTLSASGDLIDANSNETRDTRAESELLSLWDTLNLIDDTTTTSGAGKSKQDTLDAYQAQREREYATYWQMRSSGNIVNERYVATSGERSALQSQGVDVAQFEAQRTAEYAQLKSQFGNTTFDPNYRYQLSQTEINQLSDGYAWTEQQLKTALPSSVLFKSTSDTETRIEEANIVGRSIRIDTSGGVGRLSGEVTIDADLDVGNLTTAQRLALASAEADDIRFDEATNQIVILQRDDIDIAGNAGTPAQSVTINAGTHAYLGSEQDINIDRVQANQAIRIKGGGGVYEYSLRDTSQAAVSGGSLIVEASTGSVGSASRPLTVDLGGGLTVRAGDQIWVSGVSGLMSARGDLTLNEVFAREDIHLASAGSIVDARTSGALVSVQSQHGGVNLGAADDIGGDGDPLRISAAGTVDATAGGDVHLAAVDALPAPGLRADLDIGGISAGGDISLAAKAGRLAVAGDVLAPGSVTVEAGSLIMQDGALMRADQGQIAIDATGDVVVGRIEATQYAGDEAIRITTAGRILDGGDLGEYDLVAATPGAGVLLQADGGVGNASWNGGSPIAIPDALETDIAKIEAIATAGGVHIDERDGLEISRIDALDDVFVRTTGDMSGTAVYASRGNIDLRSGGKVTVLDATAVLGSTTVIAEDDILMDAVTAGNGVTLESNQGSVSVSRITGDILSLSAKEDLNLGTLTVGRSLFFNSESVTARVIHTGTDAPLAMRAVGRNGAPARLVDLEIDSEVGVRFDRFDVLDAEVSMEGGYLQIDQGRVENRALFSNPFTLVYMDNNSTVGEDSDIRLYHPDKVFNNMLLERWKLVTDPYVVSRSPLHEVVMNTVLDFSGREQSRELVVTRVLTPDRQNAVSQVPQPLPLALNIPLDIPAVNSGEEETEEEAEARRKAEEQQQEEVQ